MRRRSAPGGCWRALAVHLSRQSVLWIEKFRVRPKGARRARHQVRQRLKLPLRADRQVFQSSTLDRTAGIGTIRFQEWHGSANRDRLVDTAGLKCEIDADRTVDGYINLFAGGFLKSLLFNGDCIVPGCKLENCNCRKTPWLSCALPRYLPR